MQTLTFIARRLFYGAILMVGVVVLNFLLIHLAPGDPAEVIAGEMGGATAEMMAEIRAIIRARQAGRSRSSACISPT